MSLRLGLHSYSWRIPTTPISLAFSQLLFSHPNVSGFGSPSKTHLFSFSSCHQSPSSSAPSRLQPIGREGQPLGNSSPLSGCMKWHWKRKSLQITCNVQEAIAYGVLLWIRVWKHVVRKGDTVVDATCGNGHDTLAMLKLVKDDSDHGRVYGFDIQEDAINNTLSLLDMSLGPTERKFVKLFASCHGRMKQLLPKGICVRLVAFNLGYLPGSDKTIITKSNTTLMALEAAKEMLVSGGLISAVVYVGHPGGREEFETVQGFASGLSVEEWACTQIQTLNRPSAPILVFLFKR